MYTLKVDHTYKDPVVFLVDNILIDAININASDIHLEPMAKKLRVRFRVDGLLYDQEPIHKTNLETNTILSRIKVLSGLDIAQRRVPQDGRFILAWKGRTIDLRVSTFPSIHGEKMVIRLLQKEFFKNLSLEVLGCSNDVLQNINAIMQRTHGFFLVTGPTGSGKTTTLYAMLSKLNDARRNIITMEDPVEYQIDGITQSQINPRAGFTFECGLRSLLRQDPDIAMVGEIRDRQTAQIAIEAALTGHLVLSTLHTNDSVGAVARLLDMGIEPFLINAALTGVLAQRLVRRLCQKCKYKDVPTLVEKDLRISQVWRAEGCEHCRGLGHKGRVGIFELLIIDDDMRGMIARGEDIKQYAIEHGLVLLRDDLLRKVEDGIVVLDPELFEVFH